MKLNRREKRMVGGREMKEVRKGVLWEKEDRVRTHLISDRDNTPPPTPGSNEPC